MKKVYVGKFYGTDLMMENNVIAMNAAEESTGLHHRMFKWGRDKRGEFLKIWVCDEEDLEVRNDKIRLST